jgi:ABC-type multidrug transport system permease subunit
MKLLLNTIGVTAYSALLAIISYTIAPTESAFADAATTFVIAMILCGVFIYFHPHPIVTNVP